MHLHFTDHLAGDGHDADLHVLRQDRTACRGEYETCARREGIGIVQDLGDRGTVDRLENDLVIVVARNVAAQIRGLHGQEVLAIGGENGTVEDPGASFSGPSAGMNCRFSKPVPSRK